MYPYTGFDDVFLTPYATAEHSKNIDEYGDPYYSPMLSDADFFSPSCSGTSSPRSSASDSLLGSDESNTAGHVDPTTMFDNGVLFQEALPVKRRSWTSFKNSLPDNISAFEAATPKRRRSSIHSPMTLFPNHSAPPARRTRRESLSSYTSRDAEGESDGGATDDEYLPSPSDVKTRSKSSKSRRHTPYPPPTSSNKSLPVTPARSPTKKPRNSPPSRNKQACANKAQKIKQVVDTNAIEDIDFQCPECGWVQANRRVPDFKRHLKTHLRDNDNVHKNGYWCKGVRVQDASRYLLSADVSSYLFKDEERIGGCMRSFSRRDALKRHLDNPNITCVFDLLQE